MKNIFNNYPLFKQGLVSASLLIASFGVLWPSSHFFLNRNEKEENYWKNVCISLGLIVPAAYLNTTGEKILHNIIEKKPSVNRYFLWVSIWAFPVFIVTLLESPKTMTLITGNDKKVINIPRFGTTKLTFNNFNNIKINGDQVDLS